MMTHIVIDTSAVLAVILNEASKPLIIAATIDVNLTAPGSLHWEVGNALSSLFKRQRIDLKQALGALEAYQGIHIRLLDVNLEEAVQLANEMHVYAYGAYVLVCAEMLNLPILTLDKSKVQLARTRDITLVEV
jgi:predicted nucleic acid-binding protein